MQSSKTDNIILTGNDDVSEEKGLQDNIVKHHNPTNNEAVPQVNHLENNLAQPNTTNKPEMPAEETSEDTEQRKILEAQEQFEKVWKEKIKNIDIEYMVYRFMDFIMTMNNSLSDKDKAKHKNQEIKQASTAYDEALVQGGKVVDQDIKKIIDDGNIWLKKFKDWCLTLPIQSLESFVECLNKLNSKAENERLVTLLNSSTKLKDAMPGDIKEAYLELKGEYMDNVDIAIMKHSQTPNILNQLDKKTKKLIEQEGKKQEEKLKEVLESYKK